LRIAKEFLTNTIRHAHAANFHCKLSFSAEFIGLTLTDDGCGFDTHAEREGFGLLGMKERVDQMDGKFLINSQLGRGTEIVISVPYQPQTEPSEDKAS
jgi:two-component system sensor histidine kinase DegS